MPTTTKSRPLLVGEANPYGGDPYFALYPAPDGCSGQRLCCLILGMRRKDYLEVFERCNLCPHRWSMRDAYRRAAELRIHSGPLILFGAKVARAFGFDPFVPFTVSDGGKTLVLPHSSGLSRFWNDSRAIPWTRELVVQVAPEVSHLIGVTDHDKDDDN